MTDLTRVTKVLAEHQPCGIIDSERRTFACLCGADVPVPGGFDEDATAIDLDAYFAAVHAHQAEALLDAGLVATETQTEWGMYVPAFEECPTGADVFDTEAEARMRARYEVESRWAMGNPIVIARREVTPWRTIESNTTPDPPYTVAPDTFWDGRRKRWVGSNAVAAGGLHEDEYQ